MRKPNPGSEEAVALGCVCPVLDNCRGQGVPDGEGGVAFWFTANCPLHVRKLHEQFLEEKS